MRRYFRPLSSSLSSSCENAGMESESAVKIRRERITGDIVFFLLSRWIGIIEYCMGLYAINES